MSRAGKTCCDAAPACPVCAGRAMECHRDLHQCQGCSHLFQWPPTVTVKYDAAYAEKYARYPLAEISHMRVGYLKAAISGGRLLDVGCGRGDFVRTAKRAGFDAWGYDVHGLELGVPMVPTLRSADRWDVATFYDSLEHFENLGPVRELASRTTWILVACPFLPKTFPAVREWKHYRPGEHLHYFGERALARLFDGHRLVSTSDVEDTVRGGEQNIGTWLFRRR